MLPESFDVVELEVLDESGMMVVDDAFVECVVRLDEQSERRRGQGVDYDA